MYTRRIKAVKDGNKYTFVGFGKNKSDARIEAVKNLMVLSFIVNEENIIEEKYNV